MVKRIIPCLDIKAGRVVKGIHFRQLKEMGDPLQLAKKYQAEGADELVFLDITATDEERGIRAELFQRLAAEIEIPLTAGGGIDSLEEMEKIFKAGASRVSINTRAVEEPSLVEAAVKSFGGDRIVVAIDASRKEEDDGWEVFIRGGREATGLDAVAWAERVSEMGVEELLVTSIDGDGSQEGYDNLLNSTIARQTDTRVIASGGAGSLEDLYQGLVEGRAEAVLIASMLHYGQHSIQEIKEYLFNKGVEVDYEPAADR